MKQQSLFNTYAAAAAIFILSGCASVPTGTYVITATDPTGQPVAPNRVLLAEGSNIYTVRNGICIAYPKSTVVIRDTNTKQELAGESPYQCR